ncbi:MAG: hypothetical protein ACYTFZ_08120 [Planctomycetota bacterium]|jgi:hypothetical protein
MAIEVAIDGTKFLINGRPTYEGVSYKGKPVEGLLLNSRMIQAVFDDECPETRQLWAYPDTGEWDPERNTDEFCAHLPEYRAHGLLAVTVGLQGGGSNYRPEVYDNYLNSAYRPDGSFKQPYFDRLLRVLDAADEAGMVVIVNYFYWKQVERIPEDSTLQDITRRVTEWLLRTGHRNILVDVANESQVFRNRPAMQPQNIHTFIELAQQTTLDGRRLLVGNSTGGGEDLPSGKWLEVEDFCMPHGNGTRPEQLGAKLRRLKESEEYCNRPRPICVNEDSVFVENLEAAVAEGCSWGFYCQGYGSDNRDLMDWTTDGREATFEELSGFQTLPVNWGINTPIKRAFFDRVKAITQGA